jgi:hypothetical protein
MWLQLPKLPYRYHYQVNKKMTDDKPVKCECGKSFPNAPNRSRHRAEDCMLSMYVDKYKDNKNRIEKQKKMLEKTKIVAQHEQRFHEEQQAQKILYNSAFADMEPEMPYYEQEQESSAVVPYHQQPNPKPLFSPVFSPRVDTPKSETSKPVVVDIDFSNDDTGFDCQNMLNRIRDFLANHDYDEADALAHDVAVNREAYEKFVDKEISIFQTEKDYYFSRRKALERDLAVTTKQLEEIEFEMSLAKTVKEVSQQQQFRRYHSEHLLYEMRYNEKFNHTLTALNMMKDKTDYYKNRITKKEYISEKAVPKKTVNKLMSDTRERIMVKMQKKNKFIGALILIIILFFAGLFMYFTFIEILLLFVSIAVVIIMLYFAYKYLIEEEKYVN